MTPDDLSLDLVCRAWDLGYRIVVAEEWDDWGERLCSYGFGAMISPAHRVIAIRSVWDKKTGNQMLAHELGHAEQFADGTYTHEPFPTIPYDYERKFFIEMDAIERGSKYIRMDENYRYNFEGYAEKWGIFEMGRS